MRRYVALLIILVCIIYAVYLGVSDGNKKAGFIGDINEKFESAKDNLSGDREARRRRREAKNEERRQRKAREDMEALESADGGSFADNFKDQAAYYNVNSSQ